MHVHLIGVCGTGMGALAGLLREQGHRVTGSDTGFYPPMGEALKRWGVETRTGFAPEHLVPAPDLVVVGNVCRPDNPEARSAIERGLHHVSFPQAIEEMLIRERPSLVVAGTHGKTTTTTLLAHVLRNQGIDAGFLIGGVPNGFDTSAKLGGESAPFVLEGDEYDSAFFEKRPKFWRYRPSAAILTSLEHDHIDIYPDMQSYMRAFEGFVERLPADGVLVAYAGDANVRSVAKDAPCRVVWYGLDGDDCGNVVPVWQAAMVAALPDAQPFDLFVGGSSAGRVFSPLSGAHNVLNAVATLALASETGHVPLDAAIRSLRSFSGVRRRQELIGVVDGVRIYDDFAHHPTAVRATLAGIRDRHPDGRVIAIFEPRSATASRSLHQERYGDAFGPAELALLAPVGRPEIPADERLDVHALAEAIGNRGVPARAFESVEAIVTEAATVAQPGDSLVVMSNGAFGNILDKLAVALAERIAHRRTRAEEEGVDDENGPRRA